MQTSLEECFRDKWNFEYVQPGVPKVKHPKQAASTGGQLGTTQKASASTPKPSTGKVICIPHLSTLVNVVCTEFSCSTAVNPCAFPHVEAWRVPKSVVAKLVVSFAKAHPAAFTAASLHKITKEMNDAYIKTIGVPAMMQLV